MFSENELKDLFGDTYFCPFKVDKNDFCDKSACGLWSNVARKCGISAIADYCQNNTTK